MSIGIVISHDAVLDLSALLAQADHALYRAKDSGRNRVEIASIELILDRARRGAADARQAPACRPSRPQSRRLNRKRRRLQHACAHRATEAGSSSRRIC